jgi:hypothetical protein
MFTLGARTTDRHILCVEINNLQCTFASKIIETLASGLLLTTNEYTGISNRCFLIEIYQLYDIPTVWYQSSSQEPVIQNMLRTAYQQRALRYPQFSHRVLCIRGTHVLKRTLELLS